MAKRKLTELRYEDKPGPYCGWCPYKDEPCSEAEGPVGGVLLVGEGPGLTDAKAGRCFSGLTGTRLKKQLAKASMSLEDCRLTHIVRCHVPQSKKPTLTALRCCRPLLEEELSKGPSLVVTLGAVAFEAFYSGKLTEYHGQKFSGEGYTLVPMYKPDAYDDAPDLLRIINTDWSGLKTRPPMTTAGGEYVAATGRYKGWPELCNSRFAVDTETDGLALTSKLLSASFADTPGEALYYHSYQLAPQKRVPDHATMHNAKFDLGILHSNGIVPIDGWQDVDDTMLLAYCMNKKPLGLKALAAQELHIEMMHYADLADGGSLEDANPEEVVQYACADADVDLQLWEKLWKEATPKERRLYELIEKPLPRIMAKAQLAGVLVDVAHFETLSFELEKQVAEIEKQIRRLPGCEKLDRETLGSPTKLAKFLSVLLKTYVRSTDKFALERLQGQHPAIDLITEWRGKFKLKTAFVDSILSLQRKGFVYPEFNQTGTTTGRWSCSKPNMQQLPKHTDKTIRKGFIAPDGMQVACIDNSQIDLRSLAYLSGDVELNRIFAEDLDVHYETSRDLLKDTSEAARRVAKVANFLVVFGGDFHTLAAKTRAPLNKCEAFMNAYWAKHDGVAAWIKKTHRNLSNDGFVETAYGRRRYIPKVFTRDRMAALREGQNMPVQGTSGDVLKLQLAAAARLCVPFSQVHDELDFYVPRGKRGVELCRELVRVMEGVECPFPLKVECSVGPNLGEMEKVDFH